MNRLAARVTPWAAALLAAAAHAMALAAPWNGQPVWWLQLAGLGALVHLLCRAPSARAAGLLGWAFATAWLSGTFWWLFISMHRYGDLPWPLAGAAVLALAAFLGLYYAVACAAFAALKGSGVLRNSLLFGALWLMAELARGQWLTGFPWGASGYAHVNSPLATYAPWVGVYGVGFLASVIAAGLGSVGVQGRSSRRAVSWALGLAPSAVIVVGGLVGGFVGGGQSFSTSAGRASVALLQGNIAQDEKFQAGSGVPQALRWYGEQLQASQAQLVVAPETAVPLLPQQLPDGYWEAIQQRFSQGTQALLVGIPLGSFSQGYTNSMVGVVPGAATYRFDKHHLVPFGEFTPPLFRWFTELMNIPLGDFNRGALAQPPLVWAGQRYGPNICYEDLFGEELGARFADRASSPTVFVNASNIAWFGNSVAIDQHLHISRMRALEFERPMLRATNTGATVIINHRGEVTHALPRHTRGVLTGVVEGREGLTPYAWWVSRLGLWPLWALGLGLVLVASRRRQRPQAL